MSRMYNQPPKQHHPGRWVVAGLAVVAAYSLDVGGIQGLAQSNLPFMQSGDSAPSGTTNPAAQTTPETSTATTTPASPKKPSLSIQNNKMVFIGDSVGHMINNDDPALPEAKRNLFTKAANARGWDVTAYDSVGGRSLSSGKTYGYSGIYNVNKLKDTIANSCTAVIELGTNPDESASYKGNPPADPGEKSYQSGQNPRDRLFGKKIVEIHDRINQIWDSGPVCKPANRQLLWVDFSGGKKQTYLDVGPRNAILHDLGNKDNFLKLVPWHDTVEAARAQGNEYYKNAGDVHPTSFEPLINVILDTMGPAPK